MGRLNFVTWMICAEFKDFFVADFEMKVVWNHGLAFWKVLGI
jgi:hypothetical protein